jgi:hypothetical protein
MELRGETVRAMKGCAVQSQAGPGKGWSWIEKAHAFQRVKFDPNA